MSERSQFYGTDFVTVRELLYEKTGTHWDGVVRNSYREKNAKN